MMQSFAMMAIITVTWALVSATAWPSMRAPASRRVHHFLLRGVGTARI